VLLLHLEFVCGAILLLVVGQRVGIGARDGGVEEHGAGADPYVGDRLGALGAHLEVVAAVDLHHVEAAESAHHLVNRRGMLVGGANRDRVAVVGDDEQHWEVQACRGVERFPELALAAGALAERHVCHFVAVRRTAR